MFSCAKPVEERLCGDAYPGRVWIEAILVFLLGALPYAMVIDGPFVYDDKVYVVDNVQVKDPGRLIEAFTPAICLSNGPRCRAHAG